MFVGFLKERRRVIAAFVAFAAVLITSFWLYRLPLSAVVYPLIVCAVLGIVFLAVDYVRVQTRCRRLQTLRALSAGLLGELPLPDSAAEREYQRLITALCEEQRLFAEQTDGRFTDMVDYYTVWAHQIKTPISAMRLQLEGEDTPLSRSLLSELNRIEQYVEMVLAFLRLDSDTTDYVFREYALDDIVRGAVRRFSGEFIARRLRLCYEPIGVHVVTDEKWLTFVVEQVLSNALKYTRSGSITVRMEEPLTLCISDTGIGIAPEDLPRIFEKGYTGFNGRTDKKASGIGLYLCRRVCRVLGAEISAQSQPGQGTTVRIRLDQKTQM